MITKDSTEDTVTPLKPRPATSTEARNLITSMAHGAAVLGDDASTDQCARILGVCLWRDIDTITFGNLVDDMVMADRVRLGNDIPELTVGTAAERGEWITYYETQARCHINELLYAAGYGL